MDPNELDYALALLARNVGLNLRFVGPGCRIWQGDFILYTGDCPGALVFLAELHEVK